MRIILACDRSKGHLYPALALADYLRKEKPQYKVFFYGLKKKDRFFLKERGFSSFGLDLNFRNLILESFLRFFEALGMIFYLRPHRVLGFGGRNSLFLVFICSFFIPTFLFEPNFCLGKTNKLLSFFVRKVFLGMRNPKKKKEIKLGIPLREEFLNKIDRKEARRILGIRDNLKIFLVFGGSLGSSFINTLFLEVVSLLKRDGYEFGVIHLTGDKDFEKVKRFYKENSIEAEIFSFYENMVLLYSAADLVISRSGASSLAEISYWGLPSILLPYPGAYSHQEKNAQFFFKNKAALGLKKGLSEKEALLCILKEFLEEPQKFSSWGRNANSLKVWEEPAVFSQRVLEYI